MMLCDNFMTHDPSENLLDKLIDAIIIMFRYWMNHD